MSVFTRLLIPHTKCFVQFRKSPDITIKAWYAAGLKGKEQLFSSVNYACNTGHLFK